MDSKSNKNLTLDEIQSQSFIVFIAGYETTSSLLNYAAYMLASHPDVQDRLIAETDKAVPQVMIEGTCDILSFGQKI
ncbi:hypothetical protein DPMN_135373 [Dreissena polymorpha]|uniref:Cytochrome P450 n=1 Tax=Dreissena polymorpha TaxID=45954 RepID=A0A9D4FXX0_DREPO|nr:hypothetical protein DPMN_135373 [Dreissena polymorpha]